MVGLGILCCVLHSCLAGWPQECWKIVALLLLYYFGNLVTVGLLGLCCLSYYCCCQRKNWGAGTEAGKTDTPAKQEGAVLVVFVQE
jgi:hypothetical protein